MVSISLNLGTAGSGGALASPVQQQEDNIRATAEADKARRMRIMESKKEKFVTLEGIARSVHGVGTGREPRGNQAEVITWRVPHKVAWTRRVRHSGSRKPQGWSLLRLRQER